MKQTYRYLKSKLFIGLHYFIHERFCSMTVDYTVPARLDEYPVM